MDGVLTYVSWLSRAGGDSPHIAAWSFHPRRLVWWQVAQGPVWSEGLILVLAILGLGRAATAKRSTGGNDHTTLVRWLASYTLAITTIYCLIPYKTPWCLLQFLIGIILLAGIGATTLLSWFRLPRTAGSPEAARGERNGEQPRRTTAAWFTSKRIRHPRIGFHGVSCIVAALLLVGAGQLAWQAYRASFLFPADPENPYVFAQTSSDIRQLNEHLQGLARTSPKRWDLPVKVIWTDAYYWPLPWYLRRFEHVELWRTMPADPKSPVLIAAAPHDRELTRQLGTDYIMTGYYELRPQVLMQLWVEFDLWEAYLRRIGRVE